MARILTVGAAQLGPVPRRDTRRQVVERLIGLLRQLHNLGCVILSLESE